MWQKKVSKRNFCFETEIQLLRDRDPNFSPSLETETLQFRSRNRYWSRDLHPCLVVFAFEKQENKIDWYEY